MRRQQACGGKGSGSFVWNPKGITHLPSFKNKSPSSFLNTVLGRPVIVSLNSGVTYHGILSCLDGYMNIAMEQTEEYVDGQLKAKYGDVFIRGNNVLLISTGKN